MRGGTQLRAGLKDCLQEDHLGEVAHNMEALAVVLCHDVEEERVCVIVRLVVAGNT